MNRSFITQVKKVNGQKVYYQSYYAEAVQPLIVMLETPLSETGFV
ncbi:hypothetical protein SMIDD28_00964 [Streptococcus mitis]|uniref:Uncharacterized protein n=1 Tax=Streptococcus mitis TaxID=28037 RepID=A0A139Q8A3_STRMT|nr:hypothetical protein SMIDD28_00964 [Streptococcus mitis]